MTESSTVPNIDAVKSRLLTLLKCGDLPEARRLAECVGFNWLVRNIDSSKGHVDSMEEYVREYSSDAPCGRPRTAGLCHFKPFTLRQKQIAQWIVMDLEHRASAVLDVGCADGSFLLGVRNSIRRGTGVDLWTAGIRTARHACLEHGIAHLDFVEGCFETLSFERKFSAIVCGEVLEHCMDPGELLAKCRSLLAERGVVIVSVPLVPPESEEQPLEWLIGPARKEHVRYVSPEALHVFAEGAGLKETTSVDVSDVGWVCRVAAFRGR